MKTWIKNIFFVIGVLGTIALIISTVLFYNYIKSRNESDGLGDFGTRISAHSSFYSHRKSPVVKSTSFSEGDTVCLTSTTDSIGSKTNYYRIIFPDYSFVEGTIPTQNVCYDQPLTKGSHEIVIYFAESSDSAFIRSQTITIEVE